jgi:5-methyltetrahydrofolate corrinoid/iron sulfur protein methyltransferase
MLIVADNLNVVNPRVAEALQAFDPEPLQELARRCREAGADFLDLNPGYLSPRQEDRLVFMIESIQEAVDLPLVLDNPEARVLARGLKACREKPILNALTLEDTKLKEILPLAVEHQTDLVLLLLDRHSFSPPSLEEKIALALELRDRALAGGLREEQLIFDPVIPNLRWPDAWPRLAESIKTVRYLAGGAVLPQPARTMAGLSNLRSGLRPLYPRQLEEIAWSMLAGAGLTFALADVQQPEFTETAQLIRRMS